MCQCTWQRTGRRRSGDRASFALPPNVSRGPRKAEAADIVECRAAAAAARIFQLLLPMPRPAKARVALNCYSPARCARQVSQSTAWEFFNTNPVGALRKDDKVWAVETSARYDQAVELKKVRCRGNRLGRLIFEGVIASDLDPEGSQALEVGEPECPLCLHLEQVHLMLEAAGPDWFQRKPISDLGERAGALQARVEDLEFGTARAPAPVRGRTAQRFPGFSSNAPDFASERFG